MKHAPIKADLFKQNRDRLRALLPEKALVIVNAISGRVLARYRDIYAEHPRLLAKYLAIMSRISLEDGRRWRSARLALEATWRNPRRPRAVRQLVASLIGVDGIHAVRRLRGRAVADRGGEARAGTARDG